MDGKLTPDTCCYEPVKWDDLSQDGKIERMRSETKTLIERLFRAEQKLDVLLKHKHSGESVVISAQEIFTEVYHEGKEHIEDMREKRFVTIDDLKPVIEQLLKEFVHGGCDGCMAPVSEDGVSHDADCPLGQLERLIE